MLSLESVAGLAAAAFVLVTLAVMAAVRGVTAWSSATSSRGA